MATYAFGGKTYHLESTITSSQTTIDLRSFKEPVTGDDVTMALMNSTIAYGTLDPKTDRSEFISFTGITQNSDGTAILTGVTRGLKRGYDFTSSNDFKLSHQAGSKFILSDSPEALYAMLGASGLIVGSSPITGGIATKVLYDNAGVLGEYPVSGSGNVAMTTSPSLTTPNFSSIVNSGTLTLPTSTDTLVGRTTTDTLTNKRITSRVNTSTANSATPTLNTDNYDMMIITGQTNNITSMTTNLTGTPTEGQTIWFAMTAGSGTPTLSWGSSFEASSLSLPTGLTTVRQDFKFVWNSTTSKWRLVGIS